MLENQKDIEGVSLRFPATFGEIRAVLRQITGSEVVSELSELRKRDLELVLAECLNNVAEHAYAEAPGGEVRISIQRKPGYLNIAIRDQGLEMPRRIPGAPTADATNSTAEGGRGWLLIRALCRSVDYERRAGTNRLTLEFVSSD